MLLVAHPAGHWLQLLQSPRGNGQKNVEIMYLPQGKLFNFESLLGSGQLGFNYLGYSKVGCRGFLAHFVLLIFQ